MLSDFDHFLYFLVILSIVEHPSEAVIAVVIVVIGILVAFLMICIIKRRKAKQEEDEVEAERKNSEEVCFFVYCLRSIQEFFTHVKTWPALGEVLHILIYTRCMTPRAVQVGTLYQGNTYNDTGTGFLKSERLVTSTFNAVRFANEHQSWMLMMLGFTQWQDRKLNTSPLVAK